MPKGFLLQGKIGVCRLVFFFYSFWIRSVESKSYKKKEEEEFKVWRELEVRETVFFFFKLPGERLSAVDGLGGKRWLPWSRHGWPNSKPTLSTNKPLGNKPRCLAILAPAGPLARSGHHVRTYCV